MSFTGMSSAGFKRHARRNPPGQRPNGDPIRVFVLPDRHLLHIRFSKEALGVYPYQLRSTWDRILYSGTGVPPTVVNTPQEVRERVDETPGAIGYAEE